MEFALCFDGRIAGEIRAEGATVHLIGGVRARAPWTVLRARRALAHHVGGGVDALICHGTWAQGLFGGVGKSGTTKVFWMHGPARGRHWTEWLASRQRPHGVIVNSDYTRQSLEALYQGVPATIIHPPVEIRTEDSAKESRESIRRTIGTAPGSTVITQVSRLERWKGHECLIRAVSMLNRSIDWELWIVGGVQHPSEGAYLTTLEKLTSELGVSSRVRFLGQRSDVQLLLRSADIHCQPNIEPEPFGLTFVEALAAGLPVVATAMGGALDIVTPECGLLVPPRDEAALSEALSSLVGDNGLRRRMGSMGPARAQSLCEPEKQLRAINEAIRGFRESRTS